jgi:hypothetical protein
VAETIARLDTTRYRVLLPTSFLRLAAKNATRISA